MALATTATPAPNGVVLTDTRYFATVADQYAHVEDNSAEVRAKHITTLGDIPLVVLSAGKLEVPEAIRYIGAGHARGKVVITV